MVRILVLFACVIDGISYTRMLDLVRSLPDRNDDFGFEFTPRSVAGSTYAAVPVLQFPIRAASPVDAPARASTARLANGR